MQIGGMDDLNLVALPLLQLVTRQPAAKSPGLHPHDGIITRIEGGLLVENLDADHELFKLVAAPLQSFKNNELRKALQSLDGAERLTFENAVQLFPNNVFGYLGHWR